MTIPSEFWPLLQQRMKEEHISSASSFMLSLLTFDLATRCPHTITSQVVNEPEEMFYKVVEEIVREFPNARKKKSGWLQARLKELLEEEKEKE